jgi:hypothetical protein
VLSVFRDKDEEFHDISFDELTASSIKRNCSCLGGGVHIHTVLQLEYHPLFVIH